MYKRFKAVYIREAPGTPAIPESPILENQIREYGLINDFGPPADRSVYLDIRVAPDELVFAVKDVREEKPSRETIVSLNTAEWKNYVTASVALLKHQRPAAIERFLSNSFIQADDRAGAGVKAQYDKASNRLGASIAQILLREQRLIIGDSLNDMMSYGTFAKIAHIALGFDKSVQSRHRLNAAVLAADIKADDLLSP